MQTFDFDSALIDKGFVNANVGVLKHIGNTPLIPIRKILSNKKVRISAKAEWFNPGGSIKDRAALNMVMHGIISGKLQPGMEIIDATSGNTGIGLAMIGATLGIKVNLCMPSDATKERVIMMQAYGANVILVGPEQAARDVALEYLDKNPGKYFFTDQYNNDANWCAHYHTTGKEIIEQTNRNITHFVANLGTSGTFMGVSRRLREELPMVKLISVQPDVAKHSIDGTKHMDSVQHPGIYDPNVADEIIRVSTEEAYHFARRLAKEEGIFVGISSGAAMAASIKLAEKLNEGYIVTVFPDSGDRYLSSNIWDN